MNFDLIDKTMQEHGAKQENQRRNCGEKDEKQKEEIDTEAYYLGREALKRTRFGKISEKLAKALGKNQNTKRFFPGFFQTNPAAIRTKLIFHSIRKIFPNYATDHFTKVNTPEKSTFGILSIRPESLDVVNASRAKLRKGKKWTWRKRNGARRTKKGRIRLSHHPFSIDFFENYACSSDGYSPLYRLFLRNSIRTYQMGNRFRHIWLSLAISYQFFSLSHWDQSFLIFAGLTIHVRLAKGKILGYSVGSVITAVLVVLSRKLLKFLWIFHGALHEENPSFSE